VEKDIQISQKKAIGYLLAQFYKVYRIDNKKPVSFEEWAVMVNITEEL